ncbi:o-acetyltransferase [Moniliophthora roreri MCA 2997]|uniref:O-acetyltransferase n=1 Tax=Moniliophthora roreri (strain MCA 2997) TaxID=1381753 RepID=V2XW54_MONRO|nr:o-acetyltransferase [Moniliophthora roreri MCA 2997]
MSFTDRFDPLHCNALITRGSWLDSDHKVWQPDGCMLHQYEPVDSENCFNSRDIIFIGDSVTRNLFFQFSNLIDPTLPTSPRADGQKHSNHTLHTNFGTKISFYWDPFLNETYTRGVVSSKMPVENHTSSKAAMLVFGAGLWHLRYADTSGGLPNWEANVEHILHFLFLNPDIANTIVFLPVEEIVLDKLSTERQKTMHPADIDAMNSDLYHRLLSNGPVLLPSVFNKMLHPSETEDGLHFSDRLVKSQANILLNLHCNDKLPKHYPLDSTCCRAYPSPSVLQLLIIGGLLLWGMQSLLHSMHLEQSSSQWTTVMEQAPLFVLGLALTLVFFADRSGLWLKEQKFYSPWTFTFLVSLSLFVGLGTMKRSDKDLGFLNREQTDEWKGWMQVAILIYHYVGASKISGIYNPIRVLVAAYLFMTGYGHTMFYLRKADFGFLRVAQVLLRLNLFTLLLAYAMNTDYLFYYFAPLVSVWFIIIYATMALASHLNERTPILVVKILASGGLVTLFVHHSWPLEALFEFLERFFAIHWSAREWAFRMKLDLWIVYFGMFTALAVVKIREQRLMDSPRWPLLVKITYAISALTLVWYMSFELLQPSKFTYNAVHPYISFLPILSFVVLRNANELLRSTSSRFFAFIGRCSLETFIIQYHFWLAGDTKGILLVIPGTKWRPLNFIVTTLMFVSVSNQVARATAAVVAMICGTGDTPKSAGRSSGLPAPASAGELSSNQSTTTIFDANTRSHDATADSNMMDTSLQPSGSRRWIDQLAEGPGPQTSSSQWVDVASLKPGLMVKLLVIFSGMWTLNLLWTYPYGH